MPLAELSFPRSLAAAAIALAAAATPALAQRTQSFEDQPVGTVITTQYPGVTFAAVGNSCGGAPPINITIQQPVGGGFSSLRALGVTPGCPDFSPDYLRMTFSNLQTTVRFALRGVGGSSFAIRSYDSAGNPLVGASLTFNVAPAGDIGAYHLITVASASRNIRRIEVQNAISDFEIIDELSYEADITPPEVDITVPGVGACIAPAASIDLFGRVCDPDGEYVGDVLEYRPVGAPEGTPWTFVAEVSGALCDGGGLYTFTPPPGLTGPVFLRLTGRNLDGIQSSATTIVFIDDEDPAVDLRFPGAGQVVRAGVCFEGSVSDRCESQYTVRYRPGAAGAFTPVQPTIPVYIAPVINDPIIPSPFWNTASGATPDGPYQVQVVADDGRGNLTTVTRSITIDNTPPTAVITSPARCGFICDAVAITGTVADANLGSWTLQYTGGDSSGWTTIASGNTPVTSGTLGVWNTAGLRRCAYTLRLVATDRAESGCGRPGGNTAEHTVSVNLGPAADFNRDLLVNSNDISAFLTAWLRGISGSCE